MPVLLALSILAFVALFWAALSILGAVRRSRRRRRRTAEISTGVIVDRDLSNSTPRQIVYVDPEAAAQPAPPPPVEVPPPPPPGLRNFPTRLGKQPVSPSGSNDWAKWNPFGTDYADLTDPAPSRRSPRGHGQKKDRRR